MKIGLFGGSFNPIHKGHIEIAKEAIKSLGLDKIIFIPCQKNPFKKNIDYVDGKKRLEMINLVLEEKMKTSSFEIDRQGLSYTIDTVKYFKNKYKNDQLYLIIGSDNLTKLSKWKDIDQIVDLIQIAVFKREKNLNKINIKKFNCLLINNEIYKESSTAFLNGDFNMIDQKVLNYIGKEKLYFNQILKNILKEKRYLHSVHTKEFAIEVAKSIGYDVRIAGFAGLVHDIAKHLANENKEEARKMIEKYEPNMTFIEDYKLHQELGYIILKYIFSIEQEICDSVRYHTSLRYELTTLDKIVFIADKLCQGRKFIGIQNVRKLVLENFDEGFKKIVQITYEFNKSKGIIFNNEQEEIYQKWMK